MGPSTAQHGSWDGGLGLSAIYDIATVKRAVDKRNQNIISNRRMNVAVAPFALRKGAGVQVRLSF